MIYKTCFDYFIIISGFKTKYLFDQKYIFNAVDIKCD